MKKHIKIGMIRLIKRVSIFIVLITSLSSCYVWIMVDYFGNFSKFTKEYSKEIVPLNKPISQIKDDIYDNYVNYDTIVRWYDLLYISKYYIGLGYFVKVSNDCNGFTDSISYRVQDLKVKTLISNKHDIDLNSIDFVYLTDCSDSMSIYSTIRWIGLLWKLYFKVHHRHIDICSQIRKV